MLFGVVLFYPEPFVSMKKLASTLIALSVSLLASCISAAEKNARTSVEDYIGLIVGSQEVAGANLATIDRLWGNGDAAMLIESLRFSSDQSVSFAIRDLLAKKMGTSLNADLDELWQSVWGKPYEPHPEYADFKARLYRGLDERFKEYFENEPKAEIRLDEVRWGGVARDGIPPLKDPKVISAGEADWLGEKDVVFGVTFNGKSRAYPKRILAWHEMVKDKVGGKSINGVYCTLCGSMIVYSTEFKGKHYELGTSGFLYRSNKLMYDHETKSMWSTLEGKPVIGPLVGKGIELEPLYVVTSTWGEWKRRHPETTVLSLDTGHQRDYGEGVAYKDYFNNDRLMFTIPDAVKDASLKNKDRVLALRAPEKGEGVMAISIKFLKKNPIHYQKLGSKNLVVFTDDSGAARAYDAGDMKFASWDRGAWATDEDGEKWMMKEDGMTSGSKKALPRYPAHEAFWFGWHSAFPDTQLVK